jgi:CRP-like cAMP-binding protein
MTILGVLNQADIFFDFTPEELKLVSSICLEKDYGLGQIIFEENSESDELYIIAQGEVEILIDPALVSERSDTPSQPTTIATLRRGQSFGEIALVDQGLRSAAARSASQDTQLIVIPQIELMQLCETDSDLGYCLMRNLAADLALKIRSTDLKIRERLLYSKKDLKG